MFKSILAACVVSVGVATAALALPLGPASAPTGSGASDLVDVKSYKSYKSYKGYKGNKGFKPYKKNKWSGKKRYSKNKYSYGHGYKHPPKNWHSYSYRPLGWQLRGCMAIGPLWYCP